MKTRICLLLAVSFCLAPTSQTFAEISVGSLSKEGAKKFGITMKQRPNGDAGVMVWLEVKKENFLKKFSFGELQMEDNAGRHLVSARLQPNPVVHGQPEDIVSIAFPADPSQLENCSFLIVAYGSSEGDVGYILDVKEFLNLATAEE